MTTEYHYTAKQVERLRVAYLSLIEQALADGMAGYGPESDRPAHNAWLKWREAAINFEAQEKRRGL